VFHFRFAFGVVAGEDDTESFDVNTGPNEFGVLPINLDLVATVAIEAAGLSAKEVAVRAWIEAVGRPKWNWLVERVNPLPILVNSYVNPELRWHEDHLREAPETLRHLGGSFQFIYDNLCESWLLLLESLWSPDLRPSRVSSGRAQRFQVAPAGDGHAALGSLWAPRLN
jgi:hypothetical protein